MDGAGGATSWARPAVAAVEHSTNATPTLYAALQPVEPWGDRADWSQNEAEPASAIARASQARVARDGSRFRANVVFTVNNTCALGGLTVFAGPWLHVRSNPATNARRGTNRYQSCWIRDSAVALPVHKPVFLHRGK